jgi:hypothetical protein
LSRAAKGSRHSDDLLHWLTVYQRWDSMMRYQYVKWFQESTESPTVLFGEIDDGGREVREVNEFVIVLRGATVVGP